MTEIKVAQCPICGRVDFMANEVFAHTFKADFKALEDLGYSVSIMDSLRVAKLFSRDRNSCCPGYISKEPVKQIGLF